MYIFYTCQYHFSYISFTTIVVQPRPSSTEKYYCQFKERVQKRCSSLSLSLSLSTFIIIGLFPLIWYIYIYHIFDAYMFCWHLGFIRNGMNYFVTFYSLDLAFWVIPTSYIYSVNVKTQSQLKKTFVLKMLQCLFTFLLCHYYQWKHLHVSYWLYIQCPRFTLFTILNYALFVVFVSLVEVVIMISGMVIFTQWWPIILCDVRRSYRETNNNNHTLSMRA